MPHPPGIIDRVNYVVDFVEDPCHAPWTVYVKTALPALGDLVIGFVDVSPKDVLRFYVKPRGSRSASRFGEEAAEADEDSAGFIPDLNEVIGTRLPGSDFFAKSAVQDNLEGFWAISDVIERIAWYFLLIDLLTAFLYDWTSLINQSRACSADLGGSAYAVGVDFQQEFAGNDEPYPCPDVQKEWGTVSAGPQSAITFAEAGGVFIFGASYLPVGSVTAVHLGYYTSSSTTVHIVKSYPIEPDQVTAKGILFKLEDCTAQTYIAVVRWDYGGDPVVSYVEWSGQFVYGLGHYPKYGPLPPIG